MKVFAFLFYLTLTGGALARLGDTRERAEARYGLPKREGTRPNAAPLLQGARELTFEHEGFQIRCALLFAKDGKWYIVRKEYRKLWNTDVMKKGGTYSIRDFELDAILKAEEGATPWRRQLLAGQGNGVVDSLAKQYLHTLSITGPVWTRDDGAIASTRLGRDSVVFNLPQALKYEAELKNAKLGNQKAAADRLAQTGRVFAPSPAATPLPASMPRQRAATPPPIPSTDFLRNNPPQVHEPWRPIQDPGPKSPAPKPPSSVSDVIGGLIVFAGFVMVGAAVLKRVLRVLKKRLKHWRSNHGNHPTRSDESLPPALPSESRQRTLDDLTWDEFEMLVGEIYRRQGYSVAISAADGADGGIDLDLAKEDERVLVQCKHWRDNKVTAKEVREFYGVLISESATRGIFVTSSGYTRDALEFAAGKPIAMIDRNALEELVVMAMHDPNDDLLNVRLWAPFFVTGAKVTTPACQFCRGKMVLRNGSHGRFWGCANYPRCRGKRQAREHLVSR